MMISDWIQFGMLVILAISLIGIGIQTWLQNRLLKAQVLKDRFEMYWKTYEPVSDTQIREFKAYPRDYMSLSRYEQHYKDNDDAIRKYIYMSTLYEYLAFTFTLKKMKVPDPLGKHWVKLWTEELSQVTEFQHVHEEYRRYYPEFEMLVDNLITSFMQKNNQAVKN